MSLYEAGMCPEKERKMRVRVGQIHRLEANGRLIKAFARSAAGSHKGKQDARSEEMCLKTVKYLLTEILRLPLDPSSYQFLHDRLWAVRQDLVVQNAKSRKSLHILEACVRFHLVAYSQLCHLTESDFDSHINFVHLLECLKAVLVLHCDLDVPYVLRSEMAAIYLWLNLGSPEALNWALQLSTKLRVDCSSVRTALKANFLYLQGNFVAVFKMIKRLPLKLQLAFHCNRVNVVRVCHDVGLETELGNSDEEEGKIRFVKANFRADVKIRAICINSFNEQLKRVTRDQLFLSDDLL